MFSSSFIRIIESQLKCVQYSMWVKNRPIAGGWNQRQIHHYQMIEKTPDLQKELLRKPPEKLADSRLVQVAILGVPNAGKSTLINKLSGWQTCSVSSKVHTTRKTSKTVLVVDDTQVVFLDTPGLVGADATKKLLLNLLILKKYFNFLLIIFIIVGINLNLHSCLIQKRPF